MCGIVGLLRLSGGSCTNLEHQVMPMMSAIFHRGPDNSGVWIDSDVGLGLAHQRLSILDLSPAGHQPMPSASGRYIIIFNGEIYNHLLLREELEASSMLQQPWRGSSDTETLLAAIEAWGLQFALQKCVGMFALALWDRRDYTLQLARDRFGEKPLYWGLSGSGDHRSLLFGSDLAALRAWPGFNNSINRSALAQLLRFSSISAPTSIYSGIHQLLPGYFVTIRTPLTPDLAQPKPWWSFSELLAESLNKPFTDCISGLSALEIALSNAVKQQCLSDVPIGSFLSGGIDSSLITALMQAHSSRPVRTFTIGFEESGFNEAPYASAVAAHLGTDHNETIFTSSDAQSLIPLLPRFYTEPFADASQLPTHLVCREARKSGLVVALSGDGGDELFGGYNRYFWGPRIWNRLAWMPRPVRRHLGLLIRSLPPGGWDALGTFLPINQFGQKAHKLANRLEHVDSSDELYRSLVSHWRNPIALLQSADDGFLIQESASPLDSPLPAFLRVDALERMMVYDTLNYLPNDILTKVDRAAMAVSLETRSPFLDHRVAEVAWRLPTDMKIRTTAGSWSGKWALRHILYKYVPEQLIERPKAGFGIPIGQWLRGSLRHWAEDLLDPGVIQRQGFLQAEPISMLWQEHLSGRFDHTGKLCYFDVASRLAEWT